MSLRVSGDLGVVQFSAGLAGVLLMVGTVIGQSAHKPPSGADNPMAGMDMGPGSSMASAPGTAGAGSSSMPGMDMNSKAPAALSAGTMQMADGSTMASSAMPMNMSDPNMAAAMPGGVHTSCAGTVCTVLFSSAATGTAHVLGTTAKLDSGSARRLVLIIGNRKLTLRQGKSVTVGNLDIELTKIAHRSWTVRFTKAH